MTSLNQCPRLRPDVPELLSLMIAGHSARDAAAKMKYSGSWAFAELQTLRKRCNCQRNNQLFFELAKAGFEPIPVFRVLRSHGELETKFPHGRLGRSAS